MACNKWLYLLTYKLWSRFRELVANKNAYAEPHTALGWNIFYKIFLLKKTIVGFRILEIFPKVNSENRKTKLFECFTV